MIWCSNLDHHICGGFSPVYNILERIISYLEMSTANNPTPLPVNDELALFCSILDPIKSHFNCFGAFLLDCAIGKTYCSGVVELHWGGWLGMSHFLQGCVNWDCFLPVSVQGTYFCFCSRSHHVAEYFRDYINGTIECAFKGIR